MRVESLEVDFFGLPTGRFGLALHAVRLSVGSALDNMGTGTPVVESSTATFQRNQLILPLGSWFAFCNNFVCIIASVHATFHTSGVPKCGLIRG